jgi:uncharacterized protein
MELAYFHWAYDADLVQRLLPFGLVVDTFDSQAWVGLIPFEMRRIRLGPTPPIPWLGSFTEINVRTYVRDSAGRQGVWFFSLDVPRLAVVGVARSVFALPYCWARTNHSRDGLNHRYSLSRRLGRPQSPVDNNDDNNDNAKATMSFTVGPEMHRHEISPIDHFLSARWALFTSRGSAGAPRYARVHHPKWPLHSVSAVQVEQNLLEAAGLPSPVGDPRALFSPGVDVSLGWFETQRPKP